MSSVVNFLDKATRSLLWRTGLGRKAAAGYWRTQAQGTGFRYLYQEKEDVFKDLPLAFNDATFSDFIATDSDRWRWQESSVLEVENVLLEPERLLGILPGRTVVEQLVIYKHDRQYPYVLPYLLRPAKPTQLETAIWYDGSATRNYYHHLVDALSSLQQLQRSGLPPETPLLITRKMFEKSFFQYLYQRSPEMRQLNWYVVGDEEWVHVKKLYRLQTPHFSMAAWKTMRRLYTLPDITPWRKVFLNRDRKLYDRYLENEAETVAMLKRHGFEEVLAEHLSVEDQLQLFRETKYLVALHGAGMIQQFFMNYAQGHVLEIMPSDRLQPLYYWQAYAMGMHYFDVVVGGPMNGTKAYSVDVPVLETAVMRMLEAPTTGRVYGLTQLPALAE